MIVIVNYSDNTYLYYSKILAAIGGSAGTLLAERIRRILKKIIRKLHPIAWLRRKYGFPGNKHIGAEDAEAGGIEVTDNELNPKLEALIDAVVDLGSETLVKKLNEKQQQQHQQQNVD